MNDKTNSWTNKINKLTKLINKHKDEKINKLIYIQMINK